MTSSATSRTTSIVNSGSSGNSGTSLLIQDIVVGFLRGVVDSLNFPNFLQYVLGSNEVMKHAKSCLVMNLYLVATIWLLSWYTRDHWAYWIVILSWQVPMRLVVDVCGFYGWTIYPDLYQSALNLRHERQGTTPRPIAPSVGMIADKVLRSVMQIVGTLCATVALGLPSLLSAVFLNHLPESIGVALTPLVTFLALLVAFLFDAFVYAFFCFEMRLVQTGKVDVNNVVHPYSLTRILRLFESCWSYYLGYGFPQFAVRMTLSMYFASPLLANCFYASMMPVNVMTAIDAAPGPQLSVRLPIFARICSGLKLVAGRLGVQKAASSSDQQQQQQAPQQ